MSEHIQYYSTNLKAGKRSFRDALLTGLAPDRGLFMPDSIPALSREELRDMAKMQYYEIALEIGKKFLSAEIPSSDLLKIVKDAYNFPIPVEHVYNRNYVMRLDQGPTASFKDFAARMMGRLMQHFLARENRELLILTATSGDTGSAIANAFYKLHNIRVVILYPRDEVTERQRKQMTTLNKNIRIVAVDGKFDDCQAMVKKAFGDKDLSRLAMSSANSINIGRLLPQSIYYIYAYTRLADMNANDRILFTVPSGNFGNLMGGLIAMKMGIPVRRFVVTTNENDEVPVYWQTGSYKTIVPSKNCISSAMNVGHPSNMSRIVTLYGGEMDENGVIHKDPDIEMMRNDMYAVSISDTETRQTIKKAWENHKLLLEPHGAVGWTGLHKNFTVHPEDAGPQQLNVCLETAHPAKFPVEIKDILNIDPGLPESLKDLDKKKETFDTINNNYNEFKLFLTDNY